MAFCAVDKAIPEVPPGLVALSAQQLGKPLSSQQAQLLILAAHSDIFLVVRGGLLDWWSCHAVPNTAAAAAAAAAAALMDSEQSPAVSSAPATPWIYTVALASFILR